MKMIFKDILAQRRRNLWLLIEMVIITVITWIVLDPVMALLTVEHMPQGYEPDRLVYMEIARLKETSPRYSEAYADSAGLADAYEVMTDHIKNLDGVEMLTRSVLGGNSYASTGIQHVNEAGDTVMLMYGFNRVITDDNYFETFGIETVGNSPSAEELSRHVMQSNETVITEDLAVKLFGKADGNYAGKRIKAAGHEEDEGTLVVGVVKTVRPWKYKASGDESWAWGRTSFADQIKSWPKCELTVRLKEGYSPARWVRDNRDEMLRSFKFGNLYVRTVTTYAQMNARERTAIKADSEKRMKYALLAFFLINLALGVAGTYYLQTRSRSHDAGLMKAYGATRRKVFGMLVGEAMTVTVAGWIVGSLAYLHYALKEGLSGGLEESISNFPAGCWITDFWTHFGIVSAAVLAVLLVIVFIGVSMPARRIARVCPVDALRDE